MSSALTSASGMPFCFRRDSETRTSLRSSSRAPCFFRSIKTATLRPVWSVTNCIPVMAHCPPEQVLPLRGFVVLFLGPFRGLTPTAHTNDALRAQCGSACRRFGAAQVSVQLQDANPRHGGLRAGSGSPGLFRPPATRPAWVGEDLTKATRLMPACPVSSAAPGVRILPRAQY